MANREQKGNREKRKPKKEKPKDVPAVSLLSAPNSTNRVARGSER